MGSIRVDMTMSLDGYVTGPDDGPDAPKGIGGFRLFNWLDKRDDPGPSGDVYAEQIATRALISGRRTYELAGRWGGDHHNGVPIFVLTHEIPDEAPPGTVRYVTNATECAAQARASVGDGVARVHGAGATQALLHAGELDELELHVIPVLIGRGRRLFDHLAAEHVELDLVRQVRTRDLDDPGQHVLHLRYRLRSQPASINRAPKLVGGETTRQRRSRRTTWASWAGSPTNRWPASGRHPPTSTPNR